MKSLLVATTLVACAVSAIELSSPEFTDRHMWERFTAFKARYNKKYPSDQAEKAAFYAYIGNVNAVPDRNTKATFGETEFADQTFEQFSKTHLMKPDFRKELLAKQGKHFAKKTSRTTSEAAMNATSWDWRQHGGAVTRIKNQADCGSCWSFSSAANMEGQWYLSNGTSVSLSEQELVSCDHDFALACNGGVPEFTSLFLQSEANGYWTTDAAYPYVSGQGNVPSCNKDLIGKPAIAGARIKGWEFVHNFDETAMAAWMVDHGPIGVCLDATNKWQSYQSGVLTDCGKQGSALLPDHCVLLVGFNNTEATPYWIVKNSWGTSWGLDGYMYLQKGANLCHVADFSYSGLANPEF